MLRIVVLLAVLALGCATRQPVVESFQELPGFTPREEFVPQLNRKLAIMSEGSGAFASGERFYYIAYMTEEDVPDTKPYPESGKQEGFDDPLWGEMQSLWQQRRPSLDPAEYAMVIMDARVFPGTPGSKTRRVMYVSRDGHWYWEQVASIVFEGL